jgi:DNA-binding transcriptional MerR regulator
MYSIGRFSTLGRITIKTLRYYDEIGLLRPARVDPVTGYRYYAAAQLDALNRILVFKDLGFSLREIQGLVADDVPPDQIRGMLRRRREELERSVDRERARLARVAARLELIERSGLPAANTVAVRAAGPWLVTSVRETLASHDACEGLLEELERHTGGGRQHGQRGAIWHSCAEGGIDCEAFIVVPSRIECKGRVRLRALPAQRVASLVYRGDADYLRAFRAIRTWISASGADIIGPKREIYLDDGGAEAESATEIQFPISLPTGNVH